jgi:hypothetical protein
MPLPKPTVTFKPRYVLREVANPHMDWLRQVILDPFKPGQEFGEAIIEFDDGQRAAWMILITDLALGYYLKVGPTGDEWLSLGDRRRLAEVVCSDDWQASAGLFIPPKRAWKAIHHFCEFGTRSNAVEWIRPHDVPDGGNW